MYAYVICSYDCLHLIKRSILRQRTEDISLKRFAIDLVEKSGSFEYTRGVLVKLEEELLAEIERLGGNPMLVKVVEKLSTLYKSE